LPKIDSALKWLNSNLNEVKLQIVEQFPSNADLNIFNDCWIIFFALAFDIDDVLITQVSYGDETGVSYLGAYIKDKKVYDVWLDG
jgi:hypothetical protein